MKGLDHDWRHTSLKIPVPLPALVFFFWTFQKSCHGKEIVYALVSVLRLLELFQRSRSSENMSPGSLQFLWHTQDVIHCIFHCVLEPLWHVKFTLIMRDLLGTQQRLSVQTPQYVGLNFLVLVQPDSFSFSAFFAWNLGRQVFPFRTCEDETGYSTPVIVRRNAVHLRRTT